MRIFKTLEIAITCVLLVVGPHFLWRRLWGTTDAILALVLFCLLAVATYRWRFKTGEKEKRTLMLPIITVGFYFAFVLYVWFATAAKGSI